MSTIRFVAAVVLGILLAGCARTQQQRMQSGEIVDRVNWSKFLARHDLVYNRLPKNWGEGAWTGNGLLGAMVYLTEDGRGLRFRLGRTDVYVHNEYRAPIGEMVLYPCGKIVGGEMRVDLWNAEIRGTIKTDRGEIGLRTFTHADKIVQVIEATPSAGEKDFSWKFEPAECVNPAYLQKKWKVPEAANNPPPVVDQNCVVQPFTGGGNFCTAWRELPERDSRILYLTVGYTNDHYAMTELGDSHAPQEAFEHLRDASSAGLASLEESHRKWWHDFYSKSFLSVPDTRLESFYWNQIYKLASATRADRPAIDLMGPWPNVTPWPRYWWNLNIQLTYYPVYASNHLEIGQSLCRMIDAGAAELAKNAKEFANDSDCVDRTTGPDCSWPHQDIYGPSGKELCNLPWALHNYYMQYRYQMDDVMLRDRLFPRLKRAMNFYFHNMKEGTDGKLHTLRGLSPEYPKQPDPDPDCNVDLALIRWSCQTLLEICERLKINDPLIPKWRETLARLTPYATDKNGLMISPTQPFAESHRHYSHLLMIYPLYTMNWDQPENRELIVKSLEHWMSFPAQLRGYSYTGASSIYASIGKGEEAAKYLHDFVDGAGNGKYPCLPNGMYAESGPVIETPLSGARSLQDMLLQSWGGKIRVFPALPEKWKDVVIQDMHCEGAFLVTAARHDGKTQWVRVKSLAGEPCRLVTDIDNPTCTVAMKLEGEARSTEPRRSPAGPSRQAFKTYTISLERNQSAIIYSNNVANFDVKAVEPESTVNSFGLR